MGDSLATGGGADPGLSYVDDIYSQLSVHIPGLVLENLGGGGDSTTRMIRGGVCNDYTTGDQLGDAELFLNDHPGQVATVTIDVGGNVEKPYQSNDWKLTGPYLGTVLPQNVADIGNWAHMCMMGGGNPNIHATDFGHSLIASAYEAVLRVPPTISGTPPPGSVGVPYSYQYAVGGYPTATVTKAGKLPHGLTISKSGLLSGTPTSAGSSGVTVKVKNSAGSATDSQVLVVT